MRLVSSRQDSLLGAMFATLMVVAVPYDPAVAQEVLKRIETAAFATTLQPETPLGMIKRQREPAEDHSRQFGFGLIYLILASPVHGVAAPLDQVRGSPVVNLIVPASVGIARVAAGPRGVRPPSSGEPGANFRFGFLEFEDDPDASGK